MPAPPPAPQGIAARDGHPCDIDNLWLTDGASPAVHYMMKLLLRNDHDCILCPIPQYPLYSATIKLYGGTLLPYFLEENAGWQTTLAHLQEQVHTARRCGGGCLWRDATRSCLLPSSRCPSHTLDYSHT